MSDTIKVGQRFRNRIPLDVYIWWWYDTAAILDDYSDHCSAQLPAGEEFIVSQIPDEAPTRVLCDLLRAKELKERMVPPGRQIKSAYCSPTDYAVEIDAEQIVANCDCLDAAAST